MTTRERHIGVGLAIGVLAVGLATQGRAAQGPQRILVIGDSMMRVPAHALQQALDRLPGIQVETYTSLGSGLARLDVFDWMAKIGELVGTFDPDITLVWFGANDRQSIRVADTVVRPGTPEWDAEYGRRVGRAMDLLTARAGARVYWLELPDMRESRTQEDGAVVNRLVEQAAAGRDPVIFVSTRALLSRQPGRYSPFILGERGLPVQVREADGIHLNRAGADRVAHHLRGLILGGSAKE